MRVSKRGNSLAIRLPTALVKTLYLREGDDVTLRVAGVRTLEVERTPSVHYLLARVRRFRGRPLQDYKFVR
jgi:antitoxin MazE